MTEDLGLSLPDVMNLMAVLLSLSYGLPIIGGLLPHYLVSLPVSLRGSLFLILISLALLSFNNQLFLIPALGFFVCGNGLFKPIIPMMLDEICSPSADDRQNTYSYFYGVLNAGSFLGFFGCGIVGYLFGRGTGFYLPLITMALAFVLSLTVKDTSKKHRSLLKTAVLFPLILISLILLVTLYLQHLESLWFVIPLMILTTIILYAGVYGRSQATEKVALRSCFLYALCMMLFVSLVEQTTGSALIFIERVFQRTMDLGFWRIEEIPTAVIKSLDPLFILFLIFGIKFPQWVHQFSILKQLKLGFMSLTGVFSIMLLLSLWAIYTGDKISISWIFPSFFLLAIGELSVIPTCLERILKNAPASLKGFCAPLWSLATSYGSFMAGKSAALSFQLMSEPIQGFALIYGWCLAGAIGMVVILRIRRI